MGKNNAAIYSFIRDVITNSPPILFVIFNRPDLTQRVFERIREAQPRQLFIAADGPRPTVRSDIELCIQTRHVVEQIDWVCDVHTLYQDVNLGCKNAVATAIDWFFENVEEGIILEDDCVTHPSFFPYCHELLDHHRNDPRIWMISGQSFWNKAIPSHESYFLSKHVLIWGWATWRRAWKLNQIDMQTWPSVSDTTWLEELFGNKGKAQEWNKIFGRVYRNEIDTWDHQWRYSIWIGNGLTIVPYQNMISNIGFGETATHTKKRGVQLANFPVSSITLPLKHPKTIDWNMENDQLLDKRIALLSRPRRNFLDKVKRKLFT